MVFTADRPLFVDGVRLDTLANNIETLDGRYALPAVRNEDILVPGVDGIIPIWNQSWETNDYVLSMWVNGLDADGLMPVGSNERQEFEKNWSALARLFGVRHRPLVLRRTMGDGTVQTANARVITAVTPKIEGRFFGRFTVLLEIYNTFWRDETLKVHDSPFTVNTDIILNGFNETHPIKDAKITLTGAAVANARITDMASGHWISLPQSLAAGATWVIDCAAGTSKVGATNVRPNRSLDNNLFVLNADHSGGGLGVTTQVKLRVTSGTRLKVEARRNLL